MSASTAVRHPAKFTPSVLDAIGEILDAEAERIGQGLRVLDPFAGVGGIHALADRHETIGVELEPEWAAAHPDTSVGDATDLDHVDGAFDAVATSPCYGNRMGDTYDGRDGSRRRTYRISLGRDLSDGSAAGLQWGSAYRLLHAKAIDEMVRVTSPGGLLIVNMSNHIRDGREQLVVEWWVRQLLEVGSSIVEIRPIGTPRFRDGANNDARVDAEHLIVVRTRDTAQGSLL
jgi:SAM-dependent methyltransferase